MEKKSLKGTKTRENLMKAFAGESMARNRYCFFASEAEKAGYIQIAETFRKTALNEKEHAEVFFKFLDGDDVEINNVSYPSCYGDTMQNLLCAAKYEEEEHLTMYPEFAKVAQEEGFGKISKMFLQIAQIEKHHSERYKKLAERLEQGVLYKSEENIVWVCTHCGNMVNEKEPPKKCPVCEHEQGYYEMHCDCL